MNYDKTANSYTVYYPTGIFPEYRTRCYFDEEPYPTYNYWHHTVIGSIPGVLQKINADFNFVATSPVNFEINATGDYHSVNSFWRYEDGNGKSFNWNVYTSERKYILPELPAEIKAKYPGLSKDNFTLMSTNITKNVGLQSYDELIEKMFHEGRFYYHFVKEVYGRTKDPNGLR